jgi:hypothetical protein
MTRPPPRKYSKRRLAEIQIFRAIKLLEDEEDPVSALTLAGAAEEILDNMLHARGQNSAYDCVVEWNEEMGAFATTKDTPFKCQTGRRSGNARIERATNSSTCAMGSPPKPTTGGTQKR